MIEPQNTLLPFATESSPVEPAKGDPGFGEMLAQTLGMVPQLDPGAIAPILPDQSQGDQAGGPSGDDEAALGKSEIDDEIRFVTAPLAPAVFTRRISVGRPISGDTAVIDPGSGDDEVAGTAPVDPGVVPSVPVPATDIDLPLGDESAPDPVPVDDEPGRRELIDPAQSPGEVIPAEAAAAQSIPGDRPAPVPAEPATTPGVPVRRADPSLIGAVSARSGDVTPTRPGAEPPVAAIVPELDAQPKQVETSRPAIHLQTAGVAMTDERRVSVTDGRVDVQSTTSALPSLSPEGVSGPPTTVSSFTHPAAPTQHSALAERVLEAVELQANQPPPRTMIVDIPEIEGLRLVVSVRSGGEVHVVQSSASTGNQGLQGFLSELEGVLADRGFVMTGDGRRRGGNPSRDEQVDLPRRPRPTFNRPVDNDLRI